MGLTIVWDCSGSHSGYTQGYSLFANYVTWSKPRNYIPECLNRNANENVHKFMTKLGKENEQSKAIPREIYHGRWSSDEADSARHFSCNNFLALSLSFLVPFLSASISSCDSCVDFRHAPLCSPSSITTMVVVPHSQIQTSSLTWYAQPVSIIRPCPLMINSPRRRNIKQSR